jgi:hypothetical protein
MVEVDDPLRLINRDDGVGRNAEDAGELRFGRAQLFRQPLPLDDAPLDRGLAEQRERQRRGDDRERDEANPRFCSAPPKLAQRDADR